MPSFKLALPPAAEVFLDPSFVQIHASADVVLDLRYGSTHNFVGQNMYGEFQSAFLHREAAKKWVRATLLLKEKIPDWKFLILDALRPRSVQRILWNHAGESRQQEYVANPDRGSNHNFGFAIDLTLLDPSGREADMGTAFDYFGELAQPRYEDRFLKEGALTQEQLGRRRQLRAVMEDAGFIQLAHEWWHYDALPRDHVRAAYPIVE